MESPSKFSSEFSESKLINVVPTGTISPMSPLNDNTVPSTGDGIVTVALSVMISTTGSSSFTASPIDTCHSTISPSTTPSPISGSLNSYFAISFLLCFFNRVNYSCRTRHIIPLCSMRERGIPPCYSFYGAFQIVKTSFLY